jgi:predicted DNA-binding transcriptional regulator AlpA
MPFLPPDLSARRVVNEQQAAAFCGLSVATMRRKRQAGTGPKVVVLSTRRLGYRVDALDAWLRELEAGQPS